MKFAHLTIIWTNTYPRDPPNLLTHLTHDLWLTDPLSALVCPSCSGLLFNNRMSYGRNILPLACNWRPHYRAEWSKVKVALAGLNIQICRRIVSLHCTRRLQSQCHSELMRRGRLKQQRIECCCISCPLSLCYDQRVIVQHVPLR